MNIKELKAFIEDLPDGMEVMSNRGEYGADSIDVRISKVLLNEYGHEHLGPHEIVDEDDVRFDPSLLDVLYFY